MDKQQHIHELIDQYLMGELVGQELDKFKIRLKDDPAFLRQVEVQKAIIASIETARKDELKGVLIAAKNKKKGIIIPFGNRSLAVAASILSLLAFGLIIKTMLPQGGDQLSKSDKNEPVEITTQNNDKKPVIDSVQLAEEIQEKSNDSSIVPPAPEIALVEEREFDESADDESILTTDTDDVDFADLKKNENDIDGDQFKAQRDSMIGSKNVVLYVLSLSTEPTTRTQTQEVKQAKKEGLFNRKSKDKNNKEIEDAAEDEVTPAKALTSTQGAAIRVEFWKSIVNFKGYKFDGQKLLLFDTPVTAAVSLKSYNNASYLNKNGIWYKLVANNSFNQMSRVSDADILKTLNAK